MSTHAPSNLCTAAQWDTFLKGFPEAHLLQTSAWGNLKAGFGWEVVHLLEQQAGAQILFRRLPFGQTLAYVPKGPVGDWMPDLLPQLDALCRQRRAFALKLEPDAGDDPELAENLRRHGFQPSRQTIQPRRTLTVSLSGSEEAILAGMHQKTRYNIRLAQKRGVTVRPWDDLPAFARMMQETAARDRFAAHAPTYYRRAYELFHPLPACELLVAEVDGRPAAALMVFARGRRAWYFYGASTAHERPRMPTYLLQWEGMRWARARGCSEYDLWGIPDVDQAALEAEFASRSDGLWGVYRFKRGFGGQIVRNIGAWDRPYSRLLYLAYKGFLAVSRRAGLP